MKVLLLSRYGSLGASSRVRYLQYLPYLISHGVDVSVTPLFSDKYLRAVYDGDARWREVIAGYCHRLRILFLARAFDVVILEAEVFPFLPAVVERFLQLRGVPYVVDYDDALFHRYDRHESAVVRWLLGRKIDVVMRHSAVVVAGNEYLADRASQAGAARIEVIPTVVDAERYQPRQYQKVNATLIVGWIGTPSTSRYLTPLLPVFEALRKEMPVRFVAVGARPQDFSCTAIETCPWGEQTEVEAIQLFDVGIMPLEDTPWEHGKCGYKLIQYMACGLPVVASPVGVNRELVIPDSNGFLARTTDEWTRALRRVLSMDVSARRQMGEAGRKAVIDRYSLLAQGPRLLSVIREAAS